MNTGFIFLIRSAIELLEENERTYVKDGDGLVSMYDLEQFYAEQLIIISRDNIEPISFHDKLTEILDRLGKFLFRRHSILKWYLIQFQRQQ